MADRDPKQNDDDDDDDDGSPDTPDSADDNDTEDDGKQNDDGDDNDDDSTDTPDSADDHDTDDDVTWLSQVATLFANRLVKRLTTMEGRQGLAKCTALDLDRETQLHTLERSSSARGFNLD